ncbi:hypothetical protein HMPREF9075_02186 [Capnocytophaga sp. oral taxon 332 str. F0381]|uniref:DUF1998 domain-containing protein n=1 Tax=Capnocytophaga sp. oral taxon 332 TaxID=712213 RepID=UPI0002A3F6C1|nr:DUF1998 domain-containing protein [Capnocytophaga sp. oral taxon 332]EKY07116.1 hypothetical protein HMPREF9075_02186 [Capnocytophaga sp. oral taxon 332 str. F0381]
MRQYEQIQTRKIISAYGGVGSIIETRDGAILIEDFNKWPYFQNEEDFEECNYAEDKRFLNRLKIYFKDLEKLIKVPINEFQKGKPKDKLALISAKYFPEWFYCHNCHRFDKLENWKKHWNNNVDKDDKENFYPPKCYHCYVRNRKGKKKFFELEQVRFILISSNGEVADIPWDKWAWYKIQNKLKGKEKIDEEEEITLANINLEGKELSFEYRTSDKLDDLKGIGIKVKENGKEIGYATLSGLFNLQVKSQDIFPDRKNTEAEFKVVIRSSNSVYYPNILHSIFIPFSNVLPKKYIGEIKKFSDKGKDAREIVEFLNISHDTEIDEKIVQKLIDNNFSLEEFEQSKSENEYRYDEYKFITEKDNEDIEGKLIFSKVNKDYYQDILIKSVYKMSKIKITSVQTSYTRQEPISIESYLDDSEEETKKKVPIIKKFTSWKGKNTKYLPAVESYGEGVFFEFNDDVLNEWISNNPKIEERIEEIERNHRNLETNLNKDLIITPKYVLIHTFSHLIIKELEYLCGYPSTSIQERIYIDNELKMNGVLIYTVAGTEGSYGGITSICDNEQIGKLIVSAMMRATDCATDPICYHSDGQGVGKLNLSACFSCTLLPETSCEMFNSYLDRRILIDKEYGYFKTCINQKLSYPEIGLH